MTEPLAHVTFDALTALAREALATSGAGPETAEIMAAVLVDAEAKGLHGVGLAHLLTYCEALAVGQIDGHAEPQVERPTPIVFHVDARGGVGHLAFERCFDDLATAATSFGLALFSQRGSFTNAALDWFVDRLAERGLIGIAATNAGPAFLAPSGGTRPVFCTNPMALAVPGQDGPAVLIDQSSSATAFVNIKQAAEQGTPIPLGWALDGAGNPTTDPVAAMSGVLLAFGGNRGANIALMVELLTAGLSGANWSADAPSFLEGDRSPGIGLFVLAISPGVVHGPGFESRIETYIQRLRTEYGAYIPGPRRRSTRDRARAEGLEVDPDTLRKLREIAQSR